MPAELVTTLTATDDERLLQAEAEVRAYCGWHIAPSRTETITLDGSGSCVLLLPSLRVTSIASITEDGTTLVADDDYVWSATGIVERITTGRAWTATPRGIVIELTHGWSAPPLDVAAVVQSFAARLAQDAGLVSKTVGPFSETYSTELFGYQRAALDRYRLPKRV